MFDMDITYETDPFEPDFSQGEVEEDPFLGPRETLTKDPIKEEIKSDPNLDKNEKRRLLRKRRYVVWPSCMALFFCLAILHAAFNCWIWIYEKQKRK